MSKKIKGYTDISNRVHSTINQYFLKRPELEDLRKLKKTMPIKEYKEKQEKLKEELIEKEKGKIEELLLNMCFRGIEKFEKDCNINPNNMYAVFDSKSWRKEIVSNFYKNHKDETVETKEYKGGRNSPFREFIFNTINSLKTMLEKLGYKTVQIDNLEADDLIALLIRNDKDSIHIIASNDKDFYQLQQQENVLQYNPMEKDKAKQIIDLKPEEALRELILKEIVGDSSDNIQAIYKFDLIKSDNTKLKFPRLGEDTIKKMFELENINTKEDIVDLIALKIYTNAQFEELKIKAKYKKAIKDLYKTIKDYKEETIMEEINKIIDTEIKEIEEKIEKQTSKLTLEEQEELSNNKNSDNEKIQKILELQNQIKEITNYKIEFPLKEIKKKLKIQLNHNDTIINFDNIPIKLIEIFLQEIKKIENQRIKSKEERAKIFQDNKLFKLSREVKEINEKEEEATNEEKIEILYSQKIDNRKYVKISGKLKKEIEDFLVDKSENYSTIIKFIVNKEEYWRLEIEDERENISSEKRKEIDFTQKILERIKKVCPVIEKEKKDIKKLDKGNSPLK